MCVSLIFLMADHTVSGKVSQHAVLLSHQASGRIGDGNFVNRSFGFVYMRPLNGKLKRLTGTCT